MPLPEDPNDGSPDSRLPARLVADLQALYGRTPAIPPRVDEAVGRAARAAFARQRRFRLLLRWGGGAAAAAAMLALSFRIIATMHRGQSPPAAQPQQAIAYAPEDLLHRGRVDILDAFYLARQIDRHAPPQPQWDINHDGVVDQKDVDAIAAAAVRVTGPGQKGAKP